MQVFYRWEYFLVVVCLISWCSSGIPLTLQRVAFLKSPYRLKSSPRQYFAIRQVPGDGSCLFHSISAWIAFLTTEEHKMFDHRLKRFSQHLRELSVDILSRDNNTSLVLEDNECIDAPSLLESIANHYNVSPSEYCQSMLLRETWGGGPEIVALSNHFQRPIFVYELTTAGFFPFKSFQVKVLAKFGFPNFQDKQPFHILCADGRLVATTFVNC
jgi:hypothetical protein